MAKCRMAGTTAISQKAAQKPPTNPSAEHES